MVSFKRIILAIAAATGVLGSPFDVLAQDSPTAALAKRQITPNGNGTHNGYYYSWWADDGGSALFNLEEGGKYSVVWKNANDFIGGKGWNPGTGRTINYTGSYYPNGHGYIHVYGWTRDPLVEYLVIETYGTLHPAAGAQRKGTFTTDGSAYDLYLWTQYNKSSIDGIRTYPQYWSVRQRKRVGGSINMQNHFDAWANLSMPLGRHDYQILATVGYYSSGNATIDIQTL